LTGLLDLHAWQQKIPGLRVLVHDEPLHPRDSAAQFGS
jgi:hypothetical protein